MSNAKIAFPSAPTYAPPAPGLFLTPDEVRTLTGFATSARQIAQLRHQGISYWVNGAGRPIVARAAIEGRRDAPAPPAATWEPAWAASRR